MPIWILLFMYHIKLSGDLSHKIDLHISINNKSVIKKNLKKE